MKVLEVPLSDPPEVRVAVTVAPEPAWVRVSECELRTPAEKAAVVTHPAEQVRLEVMSTVPVKPVWVLLN